MRFSSTMRFPARFRFLFLVLLLCLTTARGHAQTLITNTPNDAPAMDAVLARFAQSAKNNNAIALRALGIRNNTNATSAQSGDGNEDDADAPAPVNNSDLDIQTRLTHALQTPGGALVRVAYLVRRDNDTVSAGRFEAWLTREENGAFTVAHLWPQPDDAAIALTQAARLELGKPASSTGNVLSLVAEWRGGRWLALRRMLWNGKVFDDETLASQRTTLPTANDDTDDAQDETPEPAAQSGDVEGWLRAQMTRLAHEHGSHSGTAHFFLQRSANHWVGLDAVWQPPSASEDVSAGDEAAAFRSRLSLEGAGFLSPAMHRQLGVALGQLGLWNEAADTLQQTELVQPGLIGAPMLQTAETQRAADPQNVARAQAQRERSIGLTQEHPTYVINKLVNSWKELNGQTPPGSPLIALRLAFEYSKLADDTYTQRWLEAAQQMVQQGVQPATNASDAAWTKLLFQHLVERQTLAAQKPRNILRSALFALRCRLNDPRTMLVLASLENAQHTVYGDFSIPMGSTEVVLWGSQAQFQRYTSQFEEAPTSEFVAALTLTKLIPTATGPMVLNEEINAFADNRSELFGTLAHEYGHVAVRQLAQGRKVPVWFNEGVATVVEGGYDGYLERVRAARDANALMSMPDMQTWDVDGERAFLAYSQANSLLDYIMDKWGRDSVLQILRAIGGDSDHRPVGFETALQQVTGLTSSELWDDWAREGIK